MSRELEMVMEVALFLGGLVATVAVGGPLAAKLARPHLFRKRSPRDSFNQWDRTAQQPAFTPMDLGPDPMQWPSSKEWSTDARKQEWPSKSWDDEHYGAHWRSGTTPEVEDGGFHVMAARRGPATPEPIARSRPKAASSPGTAPAVADHAPGEPNSGVESVTLPARRAPTSNEIEELVSQMGLAGTVQVIMQRTGWDFRKAAHYLAKNRE